MANVVLHSEVQSETDCIYAIIHHVGFDGMRLSKLFSYLGELII